MIGGAKYDKNGKLLTGRKKLPYKLKVVGFKVPEPISFDFKIKAKELLKDMRDNYDEALNF